jgi:hypothetical protein
MTRDSCNNDTSVAITSDLWLLRGLSLVLLDMCMHVQVITQCNKGSTLVTPYRHILNHGYSLWHVYTRVCVQSLMQHYLWPIELTTMCQESNFVIAPKDWRICQHTCIPKHATCCFLLINEVLVLEHFFSQVRGISCSLPVAGSLLYITRLHLHIVCWGWGWV